MPQAHSFEEYTALDGPGLADLIRRGEASRAEVVGVARALAEELNSKLNAFVEVFEQPLWNAPVTPKRGTTLGWCVVVAERA